MRPEEWIGARQAESSGVERYVVRYPVEVVSIPVTPGGPTVRWVAAAGRGHQRVADVDEHRALSSLARLHDLHGQDLTDGVVAFVQRYAVLAETDQMCDHFREQGRFQDPGELRYWDAHTWLREPSSVPTLIRTALEQSVETDDWGTANLRPYHGLPLWCYAHEAMTLAESLQLYAMIVDNDTAGLRRWLEERNYDIDDTDPASIRRMAVEDLQDRLNPYQNLIRYRLVENPTGNLVQVLHSFSLLGVIYARFTQIVVDGRPVRICPTCRQLFVPKRRDQRYCTNLCGHAFRNRNYRARKLGHGLVTDGPKSEDTDRTA